MNAETALQNYIRLAVGSRPDVRLFRNAVGFDNERKVRYGLAPGSPDLVGWKTVTITKDMVGKRIAQFLGIEVKTADGRVELEQAAFIEALQKAGGLGGFARSVDQAKEIVE